MGTSASSSGAPSGAPLVPPWVPEVPDDEPSDDHAVNEQPRDSLPGDAQLPALAPAARFRAARTSLGRFARSGAAEEMKRGVGQYVARGYGGSSVAARRFGGTVQTAGSLYAALSPGAPRQGPPPATVFNLALLQGRTVSEVIDALVEGVRPTDGTQDAEASRRAISHALSELLVRFPEADFLNLSQEERVFVVERYVIGDIYTRIVLDVGKAIQDKAPDASGALARLREVRDYVGEVVSESFRQLRAAGGEVSVSQIARLVRQALIETLSVFEGYLE